jgi:hypothetical protein
MLSLIMLHALNQQQAQQAAADQLLPLVVEAEDKLQASHCTSSRICDTVCGTGYWRRSR